MQLAPGATTEIPEGQAQSITITSPGQPGSCTVVIEGMTTNVQLAANGSRTIAVHKNEAEIDNTGKSTLTITIHL